VVQRQIQRHHQLLVFDVIKELEAHVEAVNVKLEVWFDLIVDYNLP
jgi:hypothetical protein